MSKRNKVLGFLILCIEAVLLIGLGAVIFIPLVLRCEGLPSNETLIIIIIVATSSGLFLDMTIGSYLVLFGVVAVDLITEA